MGAVPWPVLLWPRQVRNHMHCLIPVPLKFVSPAGEHTATRGPCKADYLTLRKSYFITTFSSPFEAARVGPRHLLSGRLLKLQEAAHLLCRHADVLLRNFWRWLCSPAAGLSNPALKRTVAGAVPTAAV